MEEVSTQRASLDDYGAVTYGNGSLSNSLMEPTIHDVMSLEMIHHDLGDNYLDPRSFGGVSSFDDPYPSNHQSYSTNSSTSSSTSFENVSQSSQTRSQYILHTSSSVQSKYDNPTRFESQLPAPPPRIVPTYPVKTANPATCTQYAPVRTIITVKSSSRRSHSRSANKKEPLDPQRLEDEVARNVSQIMSATKQQKLMQEAQMKNGIITNPKALFSCPDCGKGMTSQRNLQRHRQASCAKRIPPDTPPPEDEPTSDSLQNSMMALPGMDTFSHGMGSFSMHSEMSDWCSTESFSPPPPSQAQPLSGRIDSTDSLALDSSSHISDNCLAPLSLETDDSHTHSSSASHCSTGSAGNSTPQGMFTCGSCKKSVCSFRSLKRHHTTCKQFIAEFGPPETDLKKKLNERIKKLAKGQSVEKENDMDFSYSSVSSTSSSSGKEDDHLLLPSTSTSSAASDTSSLLDDTNASYISMVIDRKSTTPGSHNTCVDCNRQLCSASNLKRHRATCKAALQNARLNNNSSPPPLSSQASTPRSSIDIQEKSEHQTRTSSASSSSSRFPSSEQRVTRQSQQSAITSASILLNDPELQQKPWITVGEHLRAQHHKQKMTETNHKEPEPVQPPTPSNTSSQITARVTYYKLDNLRPVIVTKAKPELLSDSLSNNGQHYGVEKSHDSKKELKKDDCFATPSGEQPKKWKIAQVLLNGESLEKKTPLESIITTQPLSNERLAGLAEPMIFSENRTVHRTSFPGQEFQCPECKKNYSCRKNVKRHRMAVHKLTADEIARFPAVACSSAVQVPSATAQSQNAAIQPASNPRSSGSNNSTSVPKVSAKCEYKTEVVPLSPMAPEKSKNSRYPIKMLSEEDDSHSWRRSSDYDEETAETARIAAELKRSAEQEVAEFEGKRPRTELAEADTTFHEESEGSLIRSHHSSPGVMVSSTLSSSSASTPSNNTQSLPSISSWVESSKPLTVDIPPFNGTRSANSSPAFRQRRQFVCDNCSRVLSSDYSLRRHQQYCNGNDRSSALTAPSSLLNDNLSLNPLNCADPMLGHSVNTMSQRPDDDWFRHEDVPDSTTSQRLKFVRIDRSTSPGILIEQADISANRKRTLSGSGTACPPTPTYAQNDPKQARHLCQACGRFYSSEWNLERHRRESCPTKTGGTNSPTTLPDDIALILNGNRFVVSRQAIAKDSASFLTFFNGYDTEMGEISLDAELSEFRLLVDVFNNPQTLSSSNIDMVTHLADRLKMGAIFDMCVKYISDELPKVSVMHSLRLADEYRFMSLKQRLLDSISIDVFRSLSADHNYKLLDAELKAELLEKWGTFL